MAYIANTELINLGFKKLGKNIKLSDKASIYDASQIEIGDNSRIDDFCVLSGKITIGSFCHVTPMCLIAGGKPGIEIDDFCTFAYGVKVFAQSDDYSGLSMTNSLISSEFKREIFRSVAIKQLTIVGAGSVIFPGVTLAEGTAVGAMSLLTKSTEPWGIYAGSPAKRIKERNKNLLEIKNKFLEKIKNDTI